MGGAIKSMLAKQAPQRSPWLAMGARQAMQTGGNSRSARRPRIGRTILATRWALPRDTGVVSKPSSASRAGMAAIIRPGGLALKALRPGAS